MAGDQHWRLDLKTFQGFRDDRPKEEKWELIDGRPVMMPPPSRTHQRIASNLERLLNDRLSLTRPDWRADREIGVLIPEDQTYNPEPDVIVVETTYPADQIYADRFYFVTEVLSGSDKDVVLAAKLAYYQRHDPCLAVMFVRQDGIGTDFYSRAAGWAVVSWSDPATRLDIPGIGDIGALADLYRFTPLAARA